jgi:8-amino-7-oxononanoate synthase
MLAFCSNDYLGLAADPRLAEAAIQAIKHAGVGAGAAHLISGHMRAHHDAEMALADWLGYERVLLFSTGYMANLGVIASLLSANDCVIQDKWNHASLIDAAKLSGAQLKRYQHADMASLERQLTTEAERKLIATDSVFSMDGDVAPLTQMVALSQQYAAPIMVDEAHGIGVLGDQGRGAANAAGLNANDVPILMGTLGKAFGVAGAFVAASHDVIEMLIQSARSYIYTTAMPAAMASTVQTSLEIVREEQWRRDHLQAVVKQFREGVQSLGLSLMSSTTPIQPVVLGDAHRALAWSQRLHELGLWVPAIRQPTVPRDTARLRFTFSAAHSAAHVDRALESLVICQRELA